jgi:hypothetical protein
MSWLITLIDMITNLKRQEFKYYITDKDVIFLRENLSKFMQIDRNSNKNNEYKITTVYFDSLMSDSLNEKLDGINYREKFRIRMYEDDTSSLKFESKQRVDTVIKKKSYKINKEEAKQLLNCNYDFLLTKNSSFLKEAYVKFKSKGFSPSVIVGYDREAYTLPYGEIRITFDKNLRTYNTNTNIFDTKFGSIPIFTNSMQILEVKFNSDIPDHIKKILSYTNASRSAISKFVFSKKYSDPYRWRDNINPPK